MKWLMEALFPEKCMLCHHLLDKTDERSKEMGLCSGCSWEDWRTDESHVHSIYEEWIHVSFRYEGEIRKRLADLKYEGRKRSGAKMGHWMYEEGKQTLLCEKGTVITPVPLAKVREKTRGYNQARVLAESIASDSGLPLKEYLVREVETLPQKDLGEVLREKNVEKAFALTPLAREDGVKEAPKVILLVDDIVTSGATLSACKKVLKRQFPRAKVIGWAFSMEK